MKTGALCRVDLPDFRRMHSRGILYIHYIGIHAKGKRERLVGGGGEVGEGPT